MTTATKQSWQAYLLDFSPTIIYCAVPSGDFRITFVSNNLFDVLGYRPEEVYGDQDFWHDHIHPDDRGALFSGLTQLFTRDWHIVDYRFRHEKGHYLWIHDQLRLIRDEAGEAIDVVGSLSDITSLKESEKKIAEYGKQLEEQVVQRTAELVVARDEALAAEKAMSVFLSNMSHELRTPLHGILSFASFGLKKFMSATPEKLGQYFAEIHDSGDHLLVLVNDLLDLSKLRAGKMVYDYQMVALDQVVREVAREMRKLATERQIRIDFNAETKVVETRMDRVKIAQVVRNLLSNAIKFSPEKSIISLTVTCDGQSGLCLEVADQGVGIPKDEYQLIFDAFTQSSATRTNAGGTGLGLPICKEIIEHGHCGSISARNGVREGSVFTLKLPLDSCSQRENKEN